jgi:Protein of unknown function (DUF2807).
MKKLIGFVLLLALGFQALAQQSETRSVGSFKGIKSAEAIDVYLKKGDKESVKVEVTGVSLSDVITEVSGTYLKIHMDDGNYRNKNVKVYVTYVSLERISASSASNVFSEGVIKATNLDLSASSAGSIEVSVDAEAISIDASSAGDIVLEGKARRVEVEASSAGDIDAYNLESESVNASVSSAGSAKVNATKEIDAHASSGGSIRYRGNPSKSNTNSSSGGSVKKSN